MSISSKTFLYIEGGGDRVIMGACWMAEIEAKTGKHITESFDYFGGASAGGSLVSLLNVKDSAGKPKYTATEICANYYDYIAFTPLVTNKKFEDWVKAKGTVTSKVPLCNLLTGWRSTAYLDFCNKTLNSNYSQVEKWYAEWLLNPSGEYRMSNTIKPVYLVAHNVSTMKGYAFSSLDTTNNFLLKEAMSATYAFIGMMDIVAIMVDGKKQFFVDQLFENTFDNAVDQFKKEVPETISKSPDMKYFYLGTGLGSLKYGDVNCSTPDQKSGYITSILTSTTFAAPNGPCVQTFATQTISAAVFTEKVNEGKKEADATDKKLEICDDKTSNCYVWDPYYLPYCKMPPAGSVESDRVLYKKAATDQWAKDGDAVIKIITDSQKASSSSNFISFGVFFMSLFVLIGVL